MRAHAFGSAVIAGALAVTLAGCGGSSSPKPPPTNTTGGSSPATLPTTKAAAKTLAAKINLQASDMTGYTAKPHKTSASDKSLDKQLSRCITGHVSKGGQLADVNSPDFDRGSGLTSQEVSSDVTVERSASIVRRDLRLIHSPKTLPCVKRGLIKALKAQSGKLTVKSVKLSRLATATPTGSSGAFGLRIAVVGETQGVRIPFFVDIRGAAVRSLELSVVVLGLRQPYPTAEAERWLALVTRRAAALT
jgi:hypothetical protein